MTERPERASPPTKPEAQQVFISCAASDSELAKKIAAACDDRGIRTWLDLAELTPGTTAVQQIQKAVAESTFCVVLVGRDSGRATSFQRLEWSLIQRRAWTGNCPILPIQVQSGVELPAFLRPWQAFQLPRNPLADKRWAKEVARLIESGVVRRADPADDPETARRFQKLEDEVRKVAQQEDRDR